MERGFMALLFNWTRNVGVLFESILLAGTAKGWKSLSDEKDISGR